MSRLRLEMSVKANVVPASSGTATMSCIKVRVKPIEPAPIMAILRATFSSPYWELTRISTRRLRLRKDSNHPMPYGDLFNGKTWKIMQKWLCHRLVLYAAKKSVSEKILSFSFYHNLDHA